MKTAMQEFIDAITKNGLISINQTLIDGALKQEKQQTIHFAYKSRLIKDVDVDSNVYFLFTPELQFTKQF